MDLPYADTAASNQGLAASALRTWRIVRRHFWFKCFGTMAFTFSFFAAYIYLLKHPSGAVTTMPTMALDRWVGFTPWALPVYLSLWAYISLPPALMSRRRDIVVYGIWMAGVCLIGLGVFLAWPNAVPPANIDWARYPGVAFLKGVDAAGNACPSLHVATAVFAGCWLWRMAPTLGFSAGTRRFHALWCLAIVYSTMATKQHVAVDVVAGALLGAAVAWVSRPNAPWALSFDRGSRPRLS